LLDKAKLNILFYCHEVGKITYDRFFLKNCYFNGFYKGRKNFVLTPRYAKKLRAMQHRAKSIFVLKKVFYLGFRAMQLNVKFKSKIFLLTPRYAHSGESTPRYAA
jgi:hypothetical protein